MPSPVSSHAWSNLIPDGLSNCPDPSGNWDRAHTNWRWEAAKTLALELGKRDLGVVGCHLYGSVDRGEAGFLSDIDLVIAFEGNQDQLQALEGFLTQADSEATAAFTAKYPGTFETLFSPDILGVEDVAAHRGVAGRLLDGCTNLPLR